MNLQTLSNDSIHVLPIPGTEPWHVGPDEPALRVMTDFRERPSVTVADADRIDAALEHMRHAGVRCAFVVDHDRQCVVGLVTAYDIVSEKPMRLMLAAGSPRRDIVVRDIMVKVEDWRVVDLRDLRELTVGDLHDWFGRSGTTHLPVMESAPEGARRLRGLLSAAKVRRVITPWR